MRMEVTSFDFQQFYPFGPNSSSPSARVCVFFYCVWVCVFVFVDVVIFVFFMWFCQYCYVICVSVCVSANKCTASYLACAACRWRTSKSNMNTKRDLSIQRERNAHRWTERPNWIQFEHRGHLRQLLKGLRPVDPKANNRWQNCLKPSFDIIFQCDSVVPWRVYIMCWHHGFFWGKL